jgi:FkbM family methyltransferase
MERVVLVVLSVAVAILLVLLIVAVRTIASQRSFRQVEAPAVAPATESGSIDVAPPYKLVRARHGWMLVNPNDIYLGQAIIQYGECCEAEIEFLLGLISLRPGVVVEVGTNIGTHTVPLARALALQNRRLIAFEPQPVIFQNMCANLALNAMGNVTAWPNACADQPGTLYFPLPDYSRGGNFGGISMTAERIPNSLAVPCVTIDSVVGTETVSLMKIDVEGFELLVLKGGAAVIARSRPVLYVENDRSDKSKELIEWLWSIKYRLWWHVPFLFNPKNFFGNDSDQYKSVASINMLCLPREIECPVNGLEEVLSSRHPMEGRL